MLRYLNLYCRHALAMLCVVFSSSLCQSALVYKFERLGDGLVVANTKLAFLPTGMNHQIVSGGFTPAGVEVYRLEVGRPSQIELLTSSQSTDNSEGGLRGAAFGGEALLDLYPGSMSAGGGVVGGTGSMDIIPSVNLTGGRAFGGVGLLNFFLISNLAGLVIPAGTKQILIEENLQLASVPEPASIGTWLFFIGTGLAAGYRRTRLRIEKVTSFWSGRCVVHRHNPQGHRV